MLIMRHELLLVAITVILLLVEIFLPQDKKHKIILPAILLMALVTIIGFIPGPTGVLFGGMYGTSPLILLMKNILNIGVLIIFTQSVSWLKLEEQKEKDRRIFRYSAFHPDRDELYDFFRGFPDVLPGSRTGYHSSCHTGSI